MLKDVLSVVLFCTIGFAMVVGAAWFTKAIGKYTPQDPAVINMSARVIGKREEKRLTSTAYFVTVEGTDGQRMELQADGEQYGMLIAGDKLDLSYQEKRLIDFSRL